ncbi:MAG: MmgE/PrpD family protein [Rubrobacteraceae bacterium]
MSGGGRSRRVAEFVSGLRWENVPADVRAQTIRCVLDLCGTALAGSRTEVAGITASYALEAHGPGPCTIVGADSRCTPAGAALANGFAASALDIDDGYRPVKGHPGAVVFPAVLAAAERAGSSGTGFLAALVAAYEVSLRAGLILHPLYGFYHGSGSWGPIGAAAGAARLLGCNPEEIRHALGIAEFNAAMTPEMRSVDDPSMLKDGIGWGAMTGVSSAQLAGRGFTGIPSLFDEDDSEPPLSEDLGSEYLLPGLYFKLHACCRWAQPAVEGALAAARELGVGARDIARVRVHTFEAATHLRAAAPRTTEEAQFSLPWPVACALIDGEVGPDQVQGPALEDPARRALAARIECSQDPALEEAFPAKALAWVEVEASDGSSARSEIVAAQGDAETRLSDEDLTRKFKRLVEPVLGPGRTGQLIDAIHELPRAPNLRALTRLLHSGNQDR